MNVSHSPPDSFESPRAQSPEPVMLLISTDGITAALVGGILPVATSISLGVSESQ
jgi:hypothetical protein